MTIHRQLFEISDTGTFGDTGPSFNGQIKQIHWHVTASDTGCDLQLMLLPKDNDTGDGWIFYNKTNVLGADFVDWNDTGLTSTYAAGGRVRVKGINQGSVSAVTSGRLYVYYESND